MTAAHTSEVRVRIAPSPTGSMHIGTARTALFNYLFARNQGGKFILRIEDTDTERSRPEFTANILEGLSLLGIEVDEGPQQGGEFGPYAQSERLDLYRRYAMQLLETGKAYWSYETDEELEAMRQAAEAAKRPFVFRERPLTPEQREALANDATRKPSLRFRVPADRGMIEVRDLVRGLVSFDSSLIGDFVILKSDGVASFHFANVVDDALMKISHVIRGEDHLSNTARHVMLYEALGFDPPQFAHVGMILSTDRSKLSKRHGAMAVSEYILQGYLPEAFCNFLVLMGWSPPSEAQEVGSLQDFIQCFSLERLGSSGAVYDIEKLNWLNGLRIRGMALDALLTYITEAPVGTNGFFGPYDWRTIAYDRLLVMLDAVREPLNRLNELPEHVHYFFQQPELSEALIQDALSDPSAREVLTRFQEAFPAAPFEADSPELMATAIKQFAKEQQGLPMKKVMWPLRAATTGRLQGADLSKTLWILGRDEVMGRVARACQHCPVSS